MRQEAYFCTVKELDELGKNNIPRQLISHTHLIYSSPATLAFNSPGAEGFGVKRAGLAVPDSVMLIVSPGCCGRNTSVLSSMRAYQDRFYYLLMDETDIVTGRHLKKIPKAVAEICEGLKKKPSVVMYFPEFFYRLLCCLTRYFILKFHTQCSGKSTILTGNFIDLI